MNAQDPWMEMVAMGTEVYDAVIQDHLYPFMKPLIYWLRQCLTPEEKVNVTKSHLEMLKVDLILPEREIP